MQHKKFTAAMMLGVMLMPLAVFASGNQTTVSAQQKTDMAAKEQAAKAKMQSEKDKQKALEEQLRAAQARLQALAQQVAQLSMQLNDTDMSNDRVYRIEKRVERLSGRHAILGVTISETDNDKSPSNGVKVVAVSPGGPADKAGLRAGDVITSINGKSFKSDQHDSSNDQLLAFMDTVKVGDKLKVSYLHNGKPAQANVTAGSIGGRSFAFAFAGPPPTPPVPPVPPAMARMPDTHNMMWFMDTDSITGDMQLVPLSKGLGQYFGTDQGLLVVHAPADNKLKLNDGDVILKIGGRDPGSPPHAMRILHSYSPGDSMNLQIMRKGKPLSLNIKLPQDSGSGNNFSEVYREFHFGPSFLEYNYE